MNSTKNTPTKTDITNSCEQCKIPLPDSATMCIYCHSGYDVKENYLYCNRCHLVLPPTATSFFCESCIRKKACGRCYAEFTAECENDEFCGLCIYIALDDPSNWCRGDDLLKKAIAQSQHLKYETKVGLTLELSQEVIDALEIIWKDYFPSDMPREEAIKIFVDALKSHLASPTLCDIFRDKLLNNDIITIDEQKAYAVIFKEENKYPDSWNL